MLDGKIQIMADLFLLRHDRDQIFRDLFRVAVQNADPADAADPAKLPEQCRKLLFPVQVHTVDSGLLRHKDQLLHTGSGQHLCLADKDVHGIAPVMTAHGRDRAVGAVLVAALGDLEIPDVMQRRELSQL